MNQFTVMAIVLVTGQVLMLPVHAQDRTRADVKSEASSANKSGQTQKGEATQIRPEPSEKVSRSERQAAALKRKSDTAAALKSGGVASRGEGNVESAQPRTVVPPQEKAAARAKRKAEAASAVRSGEVEEGEGIR